MSPRPGTFHRGKHSPRATAQRPLKKRRNADDGKTRGKHNPPTSSVYRGGAGGAAAPPPKNSGKKMLFFIISVSCFIRGKIFPARFARYLGEGLGLFRLAHIWGGAKDKILFIWEKFSSSLRSRKFIIFIASFILISRIDGDLLTLLSPWERGNFSETLPGGCIIRWDNCSLTRNSNLLI